MICGASRLVATVFAPTSSHLHPTLEHQIHFKCLSGAGAKHHQKGTIKVENASNQIYLLGLFSMPQCWHFHLPVESNRRSLWYPSSWFSHRDLEQPHFKRLFVRRMHPKRPHVWGCKILWILCNSPDRSFYTICVLDLFWELNLVRRCLVPSHEMG